ncbi:hypothetical protein GQ457_13G021870 [Hibiscus cannabinus]
MDPHTRLSVNILVTLVIAATVIPVARSRVLPKNGCPSLCGNLSIPYPFGTEEGCFLNENFRISCSTSSIAYLAHTDFIVNNIAMEGQLQILTTVSRDCYGAPSDHVIAQTTSLSPLSIYNVSSTRNKFTAIGCDTYAYLNGFIGNKSYSAGCMSVCNRFEDLVNGSCSGFGCCQIQIPDGLKTVDVEAYSFNNHANVSGFNNCSYAFIVEESIFQFSSDYVQSIPLDQKFPVSLDWVVSDETCAEAAKNQSNYACQRSECYEPDNGSGYLCKCPVGFNGNPYLPEGCSDIDECKTRNPCNENAICYNLPGRFDCHCKGGYQGDGKSNGTGCSPIDEQGFPFLIIGLGVSIGLLVVVLSISWTYWGLWQRKLIRQREKKALCFLMPEEERNLAMHFASALKKDRLFGIIDHHVIAEENTAEIKEVAMLAERCLRVRGEERPSMKEVAMELDGLRTMPKHPWMKNDSKETESLLSELAGVNAQGDDGSSSDYGSDRQQIVLQNLWIKQSPPLNCLDGPQPAGSKLSQYNPTQNTNSLEVSNYPETSRPSQLPDFVPVHRNSSPPAPPSYLAVPVFEQEGVMDPYTRLSVNILVSLVVAATVIPVTRTRVLAKNGCASQCGKLSIPYPFGTEEGCFLNENFRINCNESATSSIAYLPHTDFIVNNITMEGQLQILTRVVRDCYGAPPGPMTRQTTSLSPLSIYNVSNTRNKFTAIGCDTIAYLKGFIGNNSYSAGCMSVCDRFEDLVDGSCSGFGCCQIQIPDRLKTIDVEAYSFNNHVNVSDFNRCSYAFIVEESTFRFSSEYVRWIPLHQKFPVSLDWCPDGFNGNPYLPEGCSDIDECNIRNPCDENAICYNLPGSFDCHCKGGYEGDGKSNGTGCSPIDEQGFPFLIIGLGENICLQYKIILISSSDNTY